MERILVGVFYAIGYILMVIIELPFWFLMNRKPKPDALYLPLPVRREHMHIVAGSGHGKTQTLQHLLVTHDLMEVAQGRRSVVVIDSQGDLITKILHLAEFSPRIYGGLSERLIYIDPTDILNPPCLNLFDFGHSRANQYSPLEREKVIGATIALYEYLFGALLGAELTNRLGVTFRSLAKLLMVVPGATIYTLMDFMEDPELVRPHLSKLDHSDARFFRTQFFSSSF